MVERVKIPIWSQSMSLAGVIPGKNLDSLNSFRHPDEGVNHKIVVNKNPTDHQQGAAYEHEI